jgi:hypothetical protein
VAGCALSACSEPVQFVITYDNGVSERFCNEHGWRQAKGRVPRVTQAVYADSGRPVFVNAPSTDW